MEPRDIAGLIDPAAERKYRHALCREAYDRGHLDGYHEGYEQAVRDLERNWQEVAKKVKRGASSPTYAELEAKRWTVRGEQRDQDSFGGPHPGDFQGRDGRAEMQARRSA